jgi:hypothetical protein
LNLPIYAALSALVVNLLICVTLTPLFRYLQIDAGEDATTPADFEAHPVVGSQPEMLAAQMSKPSAEAESVVPIYRAPIKK